MSVDLRSDIAVIGAGPAGAVAAALLRQKGYSVIVLEREHFPRFSIGESLLPQCMAFIEEAGMLGAVERAGFQRKNGAAFEASGEYFAFDFSDKLTAGWDRTYQVRRAEFDKVLADEAARMGADIRYGHSITGFASDADGVQLSFTAPERDGVLQARFCLDASGFGRVLPRLLDLDRPSDWPVRHAVFTHVRDNIAPGRFDREKILVTVHPTNPDIWFWLIAFADGVCSVGVVGEAAIISGRAESDEDILKAFLADVPNLSRLLSDAEFIQPVRKIGGYSSKVSSLHGNRFALLGNAGEFLDPIFSSGVTIALKSASLAASAADRQLQGIAVDWEQEFSAPLMRGIDTFREFVASWYDGSLQDIVLAAGQADPKIRRMICSILAGYAWDQDNGLVTRTKQRLEAIAELARAA